MPKVHLLEKVKKLRELTGVGFKDCKNAIDKNDGNIEKSIEYLRKKGIAKANKKMERIAADGLISISEHKNKFSIIEVNSETDFVAKNEEFIKFVEEISNISLSNSGKMKSIPLTIPADTPIHKKKVPGTTISSPSSNTPSINQCQNCSSCKNWNMLQINFF